MAQSRAYFLAELEQMGFSEYKPDGDIFQYIPRDFYKREPFAVAVSPKGSAIEITVFNLTAKNSRRFSDYSSAWQHLIDSQKQPVIQNTAPTKAARRKR